MIHWHEGLHLLPQHLQLLQRQSWDSNGQLLLALHRFREGGFFEVELLLSREEASVKRLRALMPSGAFLTYPGNVEIPKLPLSGEFRLQPEGFNLSLGLPKWQEKGPNSLRIGEDQESSRKVRFRPDPIDIEDENEGNEAQPVFIRKFRARLLRDTDSRNEMEVLPLGRVRMGEEVRLDPKHCPPLLSLAAWPSLFEMVSDLVPILEESAASLRGHLNDANFDPGKPTLEQLAWVLRLRSLSCYLPVLRTLLRLDVAPPVEVYLALASLCGELSAVAKHSENPPPSPFEHNAPYEQFERLKDRILTLVRESPELPRREVEFRLMEPDRNVWCGNLEPDLLNSAWKVYLRIDSPDDRKAVTDFVVSPYFKLSLPEHIEHTGDPGLPREALGSAPQNYFGDPRYKYVRVQFSEQIFSQLKKRNPAQLRLSWPLQSKIRLKGFVLFFE